MACTPRLELCHACFVSDTQPPLDKIGALGGGVPLMHSLAYLCKVSQQFVLCTLVQLLVPNLFLEAGLNPPENVSLFLEAPTLS